MSVMLNVGVERRALADPKLGQNEIKPNCGMPALVRSNDLLGISVRPDQQIP